MPTAQFLNEWSTDLVTELVTELTSLRSTLGEIELAAFAIDCHPWNGGLYLAALTSEEVRIEPSLDSLQEMAAWRLYDFASSPSGHTPEWTRLCRAMQDQYARSGQSTQQLTDSADAFLRACARAAAHPSVAKALATFSLTGNFRINVAHPDSDREFYPSAQSRAGTLEVVSTEMARSAAG